MLKIECSDQNYRALREKTMKLELAVVYFKRGETALFLSYTLTYLKQQFKISRLKTYALIANFVWALESDIKKILTAILPLFAFIKTIILMKAIK